MRIVLISFLLKAKKISLFLQDFCGGGWGEGKGMG